MLQFLNQPTCIIPFGVLCSETHASASPCFDATKTQSPIWTDSDDGAGPNGGKMDWYEDTDDTNDVPDDDDDDGDDKVVRKRW